MIVPNTITSNGRQPLLALNDPGLDMNLSTFAFTPSKYWVFPIAFAGIPWFICRYYMISVRTILQYFKRLLAGGKEKEEREERIRRLEEALHSSSNENRRLNDQLAKLRASQQTALAESTARDEHTQRSLRHEADEKAKAIAHLAALKRQSDIREAELKNLRNELQHAQTKHDELYTLLEARTRELKGAEIYLTKADTLSGAEVISLVSSLNSEILQTSAFISDSFDFSRRLLHPDEAKEASDRISELMGPTLIHLLGSVSHSDDPLLVQLAMQAAMAEFSRWIIMSWDFDGLQAEQPLAEIYHDIRETETQAVGGRWRALTRAHAQKVVLQDDYHATLVAHLSDTLVFVLVAANCTKNHEEAYRTFTQKFGERISNVVKMASRLNKAVGEEVTSADLWPINIFSGDKFDRTTMDNFEASEADMRQTVLCTTALGLQRSEKVAQNEVAEFKITMLLKPKVALGSVADALSRDVVRAE